MDIFCLFKECINLKNKLNQIYGSKGNKAWNCHQVLQQSWFRDYEEDTPVFTEAENLAAITELNKTWNISCSQDDNIWSDDLLSTHSTFTLATELIANCNADDDEEETKDEEEEQNEDVSRKIIMHEEAITCINAFMQFATQTNSPKLLELFYSAKNCVQQTIVKRKCKQVSLLDTWWKKWVRY